MKKFDLDYHIINSHDDESQQVNHHFHFLLSFNSNNLYCPQSEEINNFGNCAPVPLTNCGHLDLLSERNKNSQRV